MAPLRIGRWAALGSVFFGSATVVSEPARADEVVGALELGVRHELVKDLAVAAGGQLRFGEGLSRLDRLMPEIALRYELIKPLTIGTGYRLIWARNGANDFEVAHRAHVQAALSFKMKPLGAKLGYRLRLQDRFVRRVGEPTEHQPRLRNALELSYADWALLTPFVSGEHYLGLDRLDDEPTRRWRLMLGMQHELGPAELELYYRFDVPVGNDDPNRHMIGLGMRFDL
jgi:hypothetical protein